MQDERRGAQAARDEVALAGWEGEGGRLGAASRHRAGSQRATFQERRPRFRLDQDLSYLGLTWLTGNGRADGREAGQGLTYVEARQLWHSCRSLARFSFLVRMRDALRELMHAGEVGPRRSSPRGGAGRLEPGRRWTER